jgi:hypothetical protein
VVLWLVKTTRVRIDDRNQTLIWGIIGRHWKQHVAWNLVQSWPSDSYPEVAGSMDVVGQSTASRQAEGTEAQTRVREWGEGAGGRKRGREARPQRRGEMRCVAPCVSSAVQLLRVHGMMLLA